MVGNKKRALITGITGQDGVYLAEFLLGKGYDVSGLYRRSSNDPFIRFQDRPQILEAIHLVRGNLSDQKRVESVCADIRPDEVYNLAAQSDVGVSFQCPEETWDVDYAGVGRVVEAALRANPKARIYQASTSEMFGSSPPPQSETTPFLPVSPYAQAKLKAHQDYVVDVRERRGAYVCSGILFNHESPKRGEHFVTRKITRAFARIKHNLATHVELGNLAAKRDWGYAKDYVEAMWLMLQQSDPRDYVIATGKSYSVKDFVNQVAAVASIQLFWECDGLHETAKDQHGRTLVTVSAKHFRPAEVECLMGDPGRAKKELGWEARVDLNALVKMMFTADMEEVQKELR